MSTIPFGTHAPETAMVNSTPAVAGEPIEFSYRNWRGQISPRKVVPLRLWYGATDWHPKPQWLMAAIDCEKEAERDFALADMHFQTGLTYQARVGDWIAACFTPEIAEDMVERCDRFTEESLELGQSLGHTRERAHALVDYVYDRAPGEPGQEVGGVMNTLAALCNTARLNLGAEAERELARVNVPSIMEKIRAKQKTKPTGSALPAPMQATPAETSTREDELDRLLAQSEEDMLGEDNSLALKASDAFSWLLRRGAMAPADRAALRAKQEPHP